MDMKYRDYWRKIVDFNYMNQKNNKKKINLFSLLFINVISGEKLISRNNYLTDEETYNKFKSNLIKANITFKNVDALDLPKEYNGKYDVILLSNIFEYLQKYFGIMYDYKDMESYINELFSIINEDGKLFLAYIFDYATKTYIRERLFSTSGVTLDDFNNYEMLKVDSCRKEKIQDGVLILKK